MPGYKILYPILCCTLQCAGDVPTASRFSPSLFNCFTSESAGGIGISAKYTNNNMESHCKVTPPITGSFAAPAVPFLFLLPSASYHFRRELSYRLFIIVDAELFHRSSPFAPAAISRFCYCSPMQHQVTGPACSYLGPRRLISTLSTLSLSLFSLPLPSLVAKVPLKLARVSLDPHYPSPPYPPKSRIAITSGSDLNAFL